MGATAFGIYGDRDPREVPTYGVREAAHYLGIPRATLRSWVAGRPYQTKRGATVFRPIVTLPSRRPPLLSFVNLVEVHVLDAIRRAHGVPLPRVRRALDYLRRTFPSEHPLADERFETDGLELFLTKCGQLVNISQEGQLAMRSLLEDHLRRIERDEAGLARRLYPYVRGHEGDEPRVIMIDPCIAFGRPALAGTGIATAIIAERYKAGESVGELAEDYGRGRLEIEEAIRCELDLMAA